MLATNSIGKSLGLLFAATLLGPAIGVGVFVLLHGL
jgi:hypothetical protein